MFPFLVIIVLFSTAQSSPDAQVNQVIDDIEDLLAVESDNNISQDVELKPEEEFLGENLVEPYEIPIEDAPPGFGGERLTAGPQQPPSGGMEMNIGNIDGTFSFSYQSKDGTVREESGVGGVSQSGSWSYIGTDGKTYSLRFIADENGFQPVAEHLPQAPALPPALQRFEDAKSGLRQRSSLLVKKIVEETTPIPLINEESDVSVEDFRVKTGRRIRFDTNSLPKSGQSIGFRPKV